MKEREQVAVVTGAAGGFGKEIALTLAQSGMKIAVMDKNVSGAEKLAENILDLGYEAAAFETDVSSVKSLRDSFNKIIDKFGRIDVLVNNAGIALSKPAIEVTEEEWVKILDINLKAAFFASQFAGREMIKNGGGNIVNIASINAIVAENNTAVYSLSKTGLVSLTRSLAREWAKYNIRVNAIAPGYAKTPLTETLLENEEIHQTILKRIPMRRFCTTRDVAQGVSFLVSEASAFITGHVLVLDGGQTTG